MDPLWCQVAVCAVATIYCVWRAHERRLTQRRELLRDRVAFMLWVMVDQPSDPEFCLPSPATAI